MCEINAKLVVVLEDKKVVEFPVEWDKQCLMGDAAERLFFSEEFDASGGAAEMDVFLLSDERVKSRVGFEGEVGDLYSVRDLDALRSALGCPPVEPTAAMPSHAGCCGKCAGHTQEAGCQSPTK